ncbi:MAG: hypothetical protein WDZ30_01040, partial [Cellvibrionaceae bacterium]
MVRSTEGMDARVHSRRQGLPPATNLQQSILLFGLPQPLSTTMDLIKRALEVGQPGSGWPGPRDDRATG